MRLTRTPLLALLLAASACATGGTTPQMERRRGPDAPITELEIERAGGSDLLTVVRSLRPERAAKSKG